MSPTMRRVSGRSTRISTSFPSSRIAIRVSRAAALMRISLFIAPRFMHHPATRRVAPETVPKNVCAVVLQGRVMNFEGHSPSALRNPCDQDQRVALIPHAHGATVSGTIYRTAARFRNDDNDLRARRRSGFRLDGRQLCDGPIKIQ